MTMWCRRHGTVLSILMVALLAAAIPANACTSVPVSRGASADGSVMTAHTCDGWYDARTFVVPGQTHPEGAMFTCYKGLLHSDRAEPIKIGGDPRGPCYLHLLLRRLSVMNEHGVIMGETTIGNRRELSTDEGLLYIETLQILGLQRAKTAREAIQIMGSLAEEYGYVDGGECLTVGDQNEIWHFEIMPPGAFQKGRHLGGGPHPRGPCGRIGQQEPHRQDRPQRPRELHGIVQRLRCRHRERLVGPGKRRAFPCSMRRTPPTTA